MTSSPKQPSRPRSSNSPLLSSTWRMSCLASDGDVSAGAVGLDWSQPSASTSPSRAREERRMENLTGVFGGMASAEMIRLGSGLGNAHRGYEEPNRRRSLGDRKGVGMGRQ